MNPQQTQGIPVKIDFNLVLTEYQNRNAELEKQNIMNTVFIRQLSQEVTELKAKLQEAGVDLSKPEPEHQ